MNNTSSINAHPNITLTTNTNANNNTNTRKNSKSTKKHLTPSSHNNHHNVQTLTT
jgi:hypothetical protein